MSSYRLAILICFAASLAGCSSVSTWSSSDGAARPAVAAPDTVTLRLAEAAEKAAGALNNISSVEQMKYGTPEADDYSAAPPELLEPVTITWIGPAEQFLQMMAGRAGYRFEVLGARPAAPVTVSIDEYQQPLVKLVKSAALQVTGRADVVLDAGRRVLEVRYAPVDGR